MQHFAVIVVAMAVLFGTGDPMMGSGMLHTKLMDGEGPTWRRQEESVMHLSFSVCWKPSPSWLRLRGGNDFESQDEQIVSTENKPETDNLLQGMETLHLDPGGPALEDDRNRNLLERMTADGRQIREASMRIDEASENILTEMSAEQSSHSSDEPELPLDKMEALPPYAPAQEDITEFQANIFRTYRAQLDEVMKGFEMEPFDEQRLDPDDEQRIAKEKADLEELTRIERALNHSLTEAAKLWGGDMGRQLPAPTDAESMSKLVVDKSTPGCFEFVSAAVNASHHGQTVSIAAGEHEVGDALMWMGLDDDCEPQAHPDTLHIPEGWSVAIEGGAGAAVHGRWSMAEETAGSVVGASLRLRATLEHALVWSNLSHAAEAGGGDGGEVEVQGLHAVVLVEVQGQWRLEACALAINGGQCVQLQGVAQVELASCVVGGAGGVDHALQEGEPSAEARAALEQVLVSEAEPRAAVGVVALNRSRVAMERCRVEHVWGAGVQLLQRSSGEVRESVFAECGVAVGVDERATAGVQRCEVHVPAGGLLDCGAFYAGEESEEAAMQLSHNVVHGKLWLGGRRPGRRLVERGNTGEGPAEWDDGTTVEEGRLAEEMERTLAGLLDMEKTAKHGIRTIASIVSDL